MISGTTDGDLTADQQVARMRDDYPGITVLQSEPWIILWRGWLTPYAQRYEVQLLYCAISLPPAGVEANTVHVEVVEPLLGRRPTDPSTPVPHIWSNHVMPNRPRLCLHKESEWTPAMHIADTIVPWTIEWLAAYEGWRATGNWYAGGHNTEREGLCRPRRRRR
jgi:hypothetical protein